jgi:hypothetical protein
MILRGFCLDDGKSDPKRFSSERGRTNVRENGEVPFVFRDGKCFLRAPGHVFLSNPKVAWQAWREVVFQQLVTVTRTRLWRVTAMTPFDHLWDTLTRSKGALRPLPIARAATMGSPKHPERVGAQPGQLYTTSKISMKCLEGITAALAFDHLSFAKYQQLPPRPLAAPQRITLPVIP